MIVGFENYKDSYDFNVSGIIHVGAHIGQEHQDYKNTFGESLITHWFEPLPEMYQKLVKNLSHDENAKTYNIALGERQGTTTIYVDNENGGQSSSVLKPAKHKEIFSHIKFDNSFEIDIARLDDFNIKDVNMLVLDVQGNELNVIKGATRTLSRIDYLFTEFNTVEMYEGCPTLEDLDSILAPFGFERAQTWYTDTCWGDAFYIKSNGSAYKPERVEADRVSFISKIGKSFPDGKGVEVGVYKGHLSRQILESWKGTLYMVDVWRSLDYDGYRDSTNNIHGDVYQEAMKSIEGFEERAIMIRSNSEKASEMFGDSTLDFVYIDANHSYECVKKDIEFWYPKVRHGGFICGHDYLNIDWWKDDSFAENGIDKHIYAAGKYCGVFGVNPAVDEFCLSNSYVPEITQEWFGSWFIRKR